MVYKNMSVRLFGLLFLMRIAVESISVTSVSTLPGYTAITNIGGSFMGGSWIAFYGDFSNPSNHLLKSNISLYKVKIGTNLCALNLLSFTSTFLNCTVPKATLGANPAVTISITYNNLQIAIPTGFKTFTYSLYSTPYILNVNPLEGCPGDSISFFGRWMTNYYNLIVGMSVNQTLMAYPNTGTLNYWGLINATGTIQNNKHGDENAYITLTAGYGIAYGTSQTSWMGTQYEYTSYEQNPLVPYNFRTLARIDSISTHEGSLAGGQTITINGAGFSTAISKYVIWLDQSSCTVTAATYNQVTCTTNYQSTASVLGPNMGNGGLTRDVWYSTLQFNQLAGLVPPASSTIIANPMLPYDEGINIKSRIYGFFNPPVPATYTFYISSDGLAVVYLNADSMVNTVNPSTLIINSTTTGLPMERLVFPSTISPALHLTYASYLEIQHVTIDALSHFSMGVLISPAFLNNLAPNVLEITIYPTRILRESQLVTLSGLSYPTGGTLVFTYGGTPLTPIAWNSPSRTWLASSCANVFNSLNIGQILCSLTTTSNSLTYNITFNTALYAPRSQISIQTSTIIPSSMTVSNVKNAGTYGLFGNFTIQLGTGAVSSPFPYGMNIPQLELAINILYPQLQNQLKIQGTCNGDLLDYWFYVPFYIYNSPSIMIGNGKLFTISTSSIFGGYIEGALVTSTNILYQSNNRMSPNDGTYYNVIPSDFLSPYYTNPQLTMNINEVNALCRGDCSFMYTTSATPIVTDFELNGNTLTITGSLLSGATSVSFAFENCGIISKSQTSISCSFNQGVAGNYYPIVTVSPYGAAALQTNKLIPIPLAISSVIPTIGSNSGGTPITINGIGFPYTSSPSLAIAFTINIGNSPCTVTSSTLNRIHCTTSAFTTNSNLVVTVGTLTATNTDFQYSVSGTPTVFSVTPTYASTIVNTPITIVGQGFSYDMSALSVFIGPYECLLTAATPTQLNCDINGGPQGFYPLVVSTDYGYASFAPPAAPQFELRLQITSVSTIAGSVLGGTLLILQGFGFSTTNDYMYILIGDQDSVCDINTVFNDTTLACTIPNIGNKNPDQNYPIVLFGRLEDVATCVNSCLFKWSFSYTPYINSVNPTVFTAGQPATLCGGYLGTDITQIMINYGTASATVTSSTGTCVTITVPYAIGLSLNLTLYVNGLGYGQVTVINIPNNLFVTSISPTVISQGGADIVINGGGFYSNMVLAFGSITCSIKSQTASSITCTVGGSTTSAPQSLNINGYYITTPSNAPLTITYTYNIQVLSAVTNTGSGISGYQIIIGITNLHNVVPRLPTITSASVLLGAYPCTMIGVPTGANANCVPTGPSGTYSIYLSLGNIGYAASSITYTIPLSITGLFSSFSSYGGGMMMTVSGSGLGPGVTFTVCGFTAPILSLQGSIAYINSPLMPTTFSLAQYNILTASSLATHYTIISNTQTGSASAFDNDPTSWYTGINSPQTPIYIGVDVGAGFKFNLNSFKFFGGMSCGQYYASLSGTILQASNDGLQWVNLFTFYVVNSWWNQWTVPLSSNLSYRFFRLYQANIAPNYAINEIMITGILFLDYNLPDLSCQVAAIAPNGASATSRTNLVYTANYTTVINSINPSYGTKAGGTTVTFTGAGFQNDIANVNVLIDNLNCAILNVTATTISCITAPQTNCIENSLSIYFITRGYASTRGLTFKYADNWSSVTTWGGEVPPREGESVYIPPCTTIILDTITPILNLVMIEGHLIFLDEGIYGYITMDANYIFISGGSLQVGTEKNSYSGSAAITLHGYTHSPALPIYGNTFLIVRYGTLDLHGSPKVPTWTYLSVTANQGDYSITLAQSVNWQIGDTIAIATTSYDPSETETVMIADISSDGRVLYLDNNLLYTHYAIQDPYGSQSINFVAEVAVLTRNVVVSGSDEDLNELHGAHIMIHDPDSNEDSIGRIENIEIYNAGQAYYEERYPLYFNGLGYVWQSYARGNSIHDSFNRAIVLANTNYLTISGNVAFNIMGNSFMLETGEETYNTFTNNLAMNIMASYSLLTVDETPAAFYIRNPNNYYIANNAAGSQGMGFWYNLPYSTLHSCCYYSNPQYSVLGSFTGNTAHSIALDGLYIFSSFFPTSNQMPPIANYLQCDWWNVPNPPQTAYMESFTAWKCGRDGANAEAIGDVRFVDFIVADSVRAGIEMTYTDWTQLYLTTSIVNALVVGQSSISEPYKYIGSIGLITPQTDGLFVDGVAFYNFPLGSYSLGDGSHAERLWSTPDTGARIVKLQRLQFNSANQLINWNIPGTGIYEILDDSFIAGQNHIFIAGYATHLLTPDCTDQTAQYNAIVCAPGQKIRRVTFFGQVPWVIFYIMRIYVLRTSGVSIPHQPDNTPLWSSLPMRFGGLYQNIATGWGVPFVANYTYSVHWDKSPLDWTSIQFEQDTFDGPEWVILNLNFTAERYGFDANRGLIPSTMNTNDPTFIDPRILSRTYALDPTVHTSGTYLWGNQSQVNNFSIIINGNQGNQYQCGNILANGYSCSGSNCVTSSILGTPTGPPVTTTWSDTSIWPGGVLPIDGSSIIIPSNWVISIDTDTAVLQYLEVNGVLKFLPGTSASIRSHWIFVRAGSIVSGSSSQPTPSTTIHQIILYGQSLDTTFAFSQNVQGGNKALVVTGTLSLHGYPKIPSTLLEMNAYAGNNFIFVDPVDWSVNDIIVISASGFRPTEHEVFTIINIETLSYSQYSTSDADWNLQSYNAGISSQSGTQSVIIPSSSLTKITLSSTISYYHSGTILKYGNSNVDMRTEVALLNRNVRITTDGNGWQSTMVVTDYSDQKVVGAAILRAGSVNIDNVAFDNCGQLDTLLGCLRFEQNNHFGSSVTNTVFNYAQAPAIYINSSSNIVLRSNTIFNSRWRSIFCTSIKNVIFDSNLLIRVRERGYVANYIDPSAGIWVCSQLPNCTYSMTNNKVLGSDFYGYITSGAQCSLSYITQIGNKARSALGGFLYTNNGGFSCLSINGAIAQFTKEGIGFKSTSLSYRLTNLILVENVIGVSMRTGAAEINVYADHQLTNSIIVGRTMHSLCSQCGINIACQSRSGYVIGVADTFVETVSISSIIWIPLYISRGDATVSGSETLSNTQFANFNWNSVCNNDRDYAITSSNFSPDYSLPSWVSGLVFTNTDFNSRIYIYEPDPSWLNIGQCVDWNCTGPLNMLISDLDGSLTTYARGGWIIPNNPTIAKASICTYYIYQNAFYCKKLNTESNYYEMLTFESLDPDYNTRIFSPINITSYIPANFTNVVGSMYYNTLSNYMDFTYNEYYPNQYRRSRFASPIWSNTYYNISSTGKLPLKMKFRLQATGGKLMSVIVSIWYQNALTVIVQDSSGNTFKGNSFTNNIITQCTFKSWHGTNAWFFNENIIQFVMSSESILYLTQTDSIQVNFMISMSVNDFYNLIGPEGFINQVAVVLNIPSWTIRIVNVVSGPTTVIVQIISQTVNNADLVTSTSTASKSDLTNLYALINSYIQQNTLGSQMKIDLINASTKLHFVGESIKDEEFEGTPGPEVNPNGDNIGKSKDNHADFNQVTDWIKFIIAGAILILMLISGLLLYRAKSRKVTLKVYQDKKPPMTENKKSAFRDVEVDSDPNSPSGEKMMKKIKFNEEYKPTDDCVNPNKKSIPEEWANKKLHEGKLEQPKGNPKIYEEVGQEE